MSAPFDGYMEEQRDDIPSSRSGGGIVLPGYGPRGQPGYGPREDAMTSPEGRRSFGTIGKDLMQNTNTLLMQKIKMATRKTGKNEQMLADNNNAPVSSYIQPPAPAQALQRMASESSRIAQSMQQSAIVENVNDKLSMLRQSASNFSVNRSASERGIYSTQSVSTWGSTVSAEISTFATQKVKPLFTRSNTCPADVGTGYGSHSHMPGIGSHSRVKSAREVSFDYQLMKDNE